MAFNVGDIRISLSLKEISFIYLFGIFFLSVWKSKISDKKGRNLVYLWTPFFYKLWWI